MLPTNQTDKNLKTTMRRIGGSQAFLALLLVLVVNAALTALNPLGKYDPEKLPSAHSWIWWAAQDFVAQNPPPQVVILGSSLLMNPIQEQEANFLKKEIDSVLTHRSAYLESRLKLDLKSQLKGVPAAVNCFNFAVPGSLMSDNYLVLRTLLSGAHKPSVVVLGLALRDFIDNQVPCAAATPSYKYLSRYTDVSDLVDLTMPDIWQRGEYWLNRRFYMIGKKLDIQSALAVGASNLEKPLGISHFEECRLNAFDMSCYVPGFKSEVERNVWITKPNQAQVFQDNSAEYRRRYRSANQKLFECQKTFLVKFCELAEQAHIKVVIVNMPVTRAHVALMPAGSYTAYMDCLTAASHTFHASLLDLNGSGAFSLSDFADTCHMQASGGKKLLDLIAAELARNPEIASSIGFPGRASKVAAFGRTIY